MSPVRVAEDRCLLWFKPPSVWTGRRDHSTRSAQFLSPPQTPLAMSGLQFLHLTLSPIGRQEGPAASIPAGQVSRLGPGEGLIPAGDSQRGREGAGGKASVGGPHLPLPSERSQHWTQGSRAPQFPLEAGPRGVTSMGALKPEACIGKGPCQPPWTRRGS